MTQTAFDVVMKCEHPEANVTGACVNCVEDAIATARREGADEMRERCEKAAGWQAYCEHCAGPMTRVAQLGGSSSQCLNPKCIEDRKADEEARRRYWEEENA